MSTEKKKKFIIDVTYLALILVLGYLLLQYALPLLLPFVLAFLIAYVLRRPIRFLSRVLHAPKGLVAVLLVVLTYGTIGLLLALAGIRITATITSLVQQIPSLYSAYILPELTDFFAWLEELLAKLDPSLMSALQELQSQLLNMLWQLVSSLSVVLVGGVSIATSFATSLPGFLIRLLLMVISTFFIAVDYQKIVRFCLGCLQGSTRNLVLQVKAYVVGTLFVCIRSYALIMSITFVELSVGLTLIGVNRAILVALLIAIFDILPVLGTGGIMIPWVILSALGGDLPHAFALLNMLWQLVSSLSVVLVGGVSIATSFATSLPGFLIRLLLMVISTFFIAVDYQKIVRFCLGCLQGSTRNLVLQVKAYVVGTLFVCIRSYALIMSITFVELSVGLTLIGVNRAILVALLIAIFDILPVLGTGGIMIPWVILSALGGDLPHAFALLVLYVIITVIRNIIEPRIVGAQIGLHPVLTLMSMFVGNHLFGIVGLFGLPILLSLLRYLNDNGTISLFPASALGRADTETSR